MGRPVDIITDDQRLRPDASEVKRLWSDSSALRGLTGWAPEYGAGDGFRCQLQQTIDWFTDPANLGRGRKKSGFALPEARYVAVTAREG